ncbi:hypothetical protein D3C83_185240 [compost metagenome]
MPTMASAKYSGGIAASPAGAKPPSSSGFISIGNSGSVAAAATMARSASANTRA